MPMSALQKTYVLKLYVAGNTTRSVQALKMLNNILEHDFEGVYALKVIDVVKKSSASRGGQNIGYANPDQNIAAADS